MGNRKKLDGCVSSVIGKGETIGEYGISGEGILAIDGNVSVCINQAGMVIVGEHGVITSEIKCADIEVMGRVTGGIECSGCVKIGESGEVAGNIDCASLVVIKGGIFNGACSMKGNQEPI